MKADWDGHRGAAQWTGYLVQALAASPLLLTVPADVSIFWVGYRTAAKDGREQFWVMFVSAIAKEESNFDPDCVFQEPFPLNQKSIGLMQLSLSDTSYSCEFLTDNDIKDPRKNLQCAVRIISKLVATAGRIGGDTAHRTSGAAAYWSTLRVANSGARDSRAYIISRTQSLDRQAPVARSTQLARNLSAYLATSSLAHSCYARRDY